MSENLIPGYMTAAILPRQQVIRVKGLMAAKNIRMRENSSIIIADELDPIIYFCQTDALCNLTVDAYDISPHKTEEQKQQDQILTALGLINDRLTQLEDRINESDVSKAATADAAAEFTEYQENLGNVQSNGQPQRSFKQNDARKPKGPRG